MRKSFQILALFAAAFFTACSGSKEQKETVIVEEKPRVKIASVTAQPVEQTQDYTATVEAEAKNNIQPSSAVRIDDIYVEVGDRVRKGQKLVQMDTANLRQMKLQLENKQTEFNRTDELYKIGGASKSEWDAQKMALDVQQTAYNNLLENTTLVSPIDGIITARNYDNGDMYTGSAPVLVVEQISPVKLMINVSEGYFTQVKKGEDVDVKLDVYGDEVFKGKVNLVYPTIDAATRTFPVEIRLDNKDQLVRPGMFVRVTVIFGTESNVVVPVLSIVRQERAACRSV